MVSCGAPPAAGAAGAAGAADVALPPPVTVTLLNHQPLPGVWAYRFSVWPPPGTADPAIVATKPESSQNGFPSAAPTSGRDCPNSALASIWPPPSIVPSQTWTSSAPAQPCAVLSTNQPATVKKPLPGTVLPAAGTSMKPAYVLSRMPPGPGAHSADWADAEGTDANNSAATAPNSA